MPLKVIDGSPTSISKFIREEEERKAMTRERTTKYSVKATYDDVLIHVEADNDAEAIKKAESELKKFRFLHWKLEIQR